MNSPLITPTLNTAYRLTHARGGRQFGLAAKMLAICTLLLGLSPFASWASAPVNINLASAEVLAESLQGDESHALAELEVFIGKQVKIQAEPLYIQEQFDVVMM